MGRRHLRTGWFRRVPEGRPEQPQPGRHTREYLASVEHGVGMHPLGAAARVTFVEHHGHTAQDVATDDRGDRHSHTPTRG